MKSRCKLITVVAALMILGAGPPVMAATNTAVNVATPVITLSDSPAVTINSVAGFALVKAVFDNSGNCLVTSNADATCNGGATTITVPANTALKFVIYVKNPTGVALSDIRFKDVLDTSGTGFTYSAGTIKYDETAADTATVAQIYTAVNGGAAQTDAISGVDFASYNAGTIAIGAVAGQVNATVNIPANKTCAIIFTATKL